MIKNDAIGAFSRYSLSFLSSSLASLFPRPLYLHSLKTARWRAGHLASNNYFEEKIRSF